MEGWLEALMQMELSSKRQWFVMRLCKQKIIEVVGS